MEYESHFCYIPTSCRHDQLLFITLHIAVGVAEWLMHHGNPLKKELVFLDPPRPFGDVMISIFYDSVTESSLLSLLSLCTLNIFYFTLEGSVRSAVSTVSGQPLRTPPLTSTFLSSDGLWITAFLTSVIILASFGVLSGILNLAMTQREKFVIVVDPIQPVPVSELPMSEALRSTDDRTRQLAYYDLKLMVDEKDSRLLDLLKLSHPGRNPYAWKSVLAPLHNLIDDARKEFKALTTDVQRAMEEPEANKTSPSKEKLKRGGLFSSTPILENLHCNKEAISKFRDLVSPIEAKVRFRNIDRVAGLKSPARKLVAVPANLAKAFLEKVKALAKDMLTKYVVIVHPGSKTTDITKELRKTLTQYKFLIWTTQILVNISEFSIRTDADGVISTTLGSIITLHIQFYETVEELLETLRPLRVSISIEELVKLVNLLSEYKKSLVFFYINYAASATILQIPHQLMKRWTRICLSDLSHAKKKSIEKDENNPGNTLFPTDED